MYIKPSITHRHSYYGQGYIAGTGDGIVSVGGVPAIRPIWLFVWQDMGDVPILVARTFSNEQGEYLFAHLDTSKRYFIIAKDAVAHKTSHYEPICYDNVAPAADLTADEIRGLWETMGG